MNKTLLILLSLIMMLSSSLSLIAHANESDDIILPTPVKVVDFSKSFDELAVEDEKFEVEENVAKPVFVYDEEMGQVLKLGKAVIKNREYVKMYDDESMYYISTPCILSEDTEYSTIHISNPYAGMDHLVEYEPYEDVNVTKYRNSEQPLWEEGITISYWIKTPSGEDGYGLNSNVVGFTSERFQIQADDYSRYLCTVKYDLDYNKYTEAEKETLGIGICGVDKDSDFYFSLDEEKTYNGKPLYDFESLGSIYWMNKYFLNGYVKYDDGTIVACENIINQFNPDISYYEEYSVAPYLGTSETDHDPGTSKLRYAWTYSEMWLDASSSFYFENDNKYTNKQLNPNHKESFDTVMGMQDYNCFSINSWKGSGSVSEADSYGNAAKSPVTVPDQWHHVSVIIQNDWVKYFLDGSEIDIEEYYSSYGTNGLAEGHPGHSLWKRFNKGTGSRYGYGSYNLRSYGCYYGAFCSPTIMEWITLDCVNLTIGGGNRNGDGYMMYADTDEIYIKNVVFYDTMLTDEQIKYLATVPDIYTKEYTGRLGDINIDKKITVRDALAILKHSAGLEKLNEEKVFFADVNSDDNVDSKDALLVLKYVAKIVETI